MPVREGPAQPAPPPKQESVNEAPTFSAEKARGGQIILNTPIRRGIFIGGLAAVVVIALILAIFA